MVCWTAFSTTHIPEYLAAILSFTLITFVIVVMLTIAGYAVGLLKSISVITMIPTSIALGAMMALMMNKYHDGSLPSWEDYFHEVKTD